jgi:hypothetical protein
LKYYQLIRSCIGLATVIFCSACTINQMKHDEVVIPDQVRSGSVDVAKRATGITSGRVGWGRFTPFYIPVAPVHIQGDVSEQLTASVAEALKAAGYNTPDGPRYSHVDTSILKVHVSKMKFNNYTWFIPIVPTWGDVELSLRLEARDGTLLWEKVLEGDSTNLIFWDGYNHAATGAMNELVEEMAIVFASDEFYDASMKLKKFNEFAREK